jgi:hypothetical protein
LCIGEERKCSAHVKPCHDVGVSFIPMIAETIGGWSEVAVENITAIGRYLSHRLGQEPAEAIHHLLQRLSITLWRRNASMWVSRAHTGQS